MANGIAYFAAFAEWPSRGPRRAHLCTYMYVCAKECFCVCIRVNKDVVLNANNICTASAKSKKTNEKKGDEAELNTKWTIC